MRKDYVSSFDGTLASLSAPTRTIYLLILKRKTHKDNRYCKKDQFFHSVENWSEASGYSIRTVQYALKELRDLEIVDWEERIGRSTLYTHKKYITIYTPKNKGIYCTPPTHQMHPTPAPNAPITTKDLTNKDLTTTNINIKKYNDMVQEYGKEATDAVVESIKQRNGKIQNPTGLMIHALRHGYNPKTPEMIRKEKLSERSENLNRQMEERLIEQKKLQEESDKGDREFANKTIADFFAKHEDL